jgi:hypothetical protein
MMDDIACRMCISKKNNLQVLCHKEILVEESTKLVHEQVEETMHNTAKNYNAPKKIFS